VRWTARRPGGPDPALDSARRLRRVVARGIGRRARRWGAPAHAAVRGRLSDWLDGGLGPRVRERVVAHLRGCPSCRAFARTLGATAALLRDLPAAQVPAAARGRLRERVAAGVRARVLV
jgi:hypothetical protein